MFIVYYTKGTYEDYTKVIVFVTTDRNKASKWVLKFNKMVDKWSKIYLEKRYCELASNFVDSTMENIFYFSEIGTAYFEPVEVR